MEKVIFYLEWLPLPKAQFNILAMLAEQGGSFSGNYSDMCRYLNVTPQSRNRDALRTAIETLSSNGFIEWESRGRTQHLKLIPKDREVKLPRRWVQSVIRHDYSSESVALAPVLKVFIWIFAHCSNDGITTNEMIAANLKISESTVCAAKNVLQYEYENITRKKVYSWWGDDCFCMGQELAANAWWTDI